MDIWIFAKQYLIYCKKIAVSINRYFDRYLEIFEKSIFVPFFAILIFYAFNYLSKKIFGDMATKNSFVYWAWWISYLLGIFLLVVPAVGSIRKKINIMNKK